jgi:hypothetical protein
MDLYTVTFLLDEDDKEIEALKAQIDADLGKLGVKTLNNMAFWTKYVDYIFFSGYKAIKEHENSGSLTLVCYFCLGTA